MEPILDSPPPESNAQLAQWHLNRVLCSTEFSAAPRQQAFLRFIVEEEIAGRGHQLKETLIAIAVYGKPADYDPRVDSVVRVEASKLRQRLKNYYEQHGAQDKVRFSIPKGAYQPVIDYFTPPDDTTPPPIKRSRWKVAFFAATALLAAVSGVLLWQLNRPAPVDPSKIQISRLTEPGSYSANPAASPRGDFAVYTSDRESSELLNLWRQPLDGGAPVRLGKSEFNQEMPTVSADGSIIVHRMNKQGGFLAKIPVLGGLAQPIRESAGGRNPRFAPRGNAILYWVPQDEYSVDHGKVFLDSMEPKFNQGPIRLFGDFAHASFPIWSDSANHVLAIGTWRSNIPEKEFDAWILKLDGVNPTGGPKKTGLFPALKATGLYSILSQRNQVEVADWSKGWLYFTLPMGESIDLFRVALNPDQGTVDGPFQRITFGAGPVKTPRLTADGRILFSRLTVSYDLFSCNLQPAPAPCDDLRRLTSETGQIHRPAVHASGRVGIWEKAGPGLEEQLWFFDLTSGARLALGLGMERTLSHALISPDGGWAAFRVNDPGYQPIYLQPLAGGPARRICENCGTPSDWSDDGNKIFYITGGKPARVGLLDVHNGEHGDLIEHPSYDLYGARVRVNSSGDGWAAFYVDNGTRTRQILLAPLRKFRPEAPEHWVPFTDGAHWDVSPAWAPDGKTIYYINRHDGYACIMARPVDIATGKASGPPWVVKHFHSARQTLMTTSNRRGDAALWIANNRIYFPLDNRDSDLWKISLLGGTN